MDSYTEVRKFTAMNDTPTSPLVPAYTLPIQVQRKNEAMNQALCATSASARAPVRITNNLAKDDTWQINMAPFLGIGRGQPLHVQTDRVLCNLYKHFKMKMRMTKWRVIEMPPLLGPENTMCECPFCNASIKTAVRYSTTSRTHIAAALFCMACCLCCVPYSSDSAKNADHYCPSCNKYLGTYQK